MNNRRKLIVALVASALASPLSSLAQRPAEMKRIGFLGVASASGYVKEIDAIRSGLRDLGYVEGKNIVIEYRWAESSLDRLKEMAAELVALKVDVIITHSNFGAITAAQATKTIPIVLAEAPDPVAMGLVASLARPGGNITGSTGFQAELAAKRIELLKEVAPRVIRMAVLVNALIPASAGLVRGMEAASKQMKVELHQFAVKGSEELPAAFAAMAKQRIEAAVISETPLFQSNAAVIAALAVTHRLPAIGLTIFAEAGGLLGYGANRPLLWRRSATFVDKILKGAKPGDLPIERATKFDLIINLKTAKTLGIKIPQQLLQRADKVIE